MLFSDASIKCCKSLVKLWKKLDLDFIPVKILHESLETSEPK